MRKRLGIIPKSQKFVKQKTSESQSDDHDGVEDFWIECSKLVRRFSIFTIISNSWHQLQAIKGTFFDEDERIEAKIMQSVYNICVISSIILVYFSYKFEHKFILKIMPFFILVFRNTIRLFDFENSQLYNK